jgi:pimeloyl-ACP methyl ester carboxylesterase
MECVSQHAGLCDNAVVDRIYRSPQGSRRVRAWCTSRLERWARAHESVTIPSVLGDTAVVATGKGENVCIYLPGTNFTAATSIPFLDALASHCRVYAADLPGQPGLSSPTRPRDEVSGYRRWIADLVGWVRTSHPKARLVLVGHSRGAAIALTADCDQIDRLALLSPAGLCAVRPSLPMLRATLPWLLRRNEAGSRRLLAYMSGPGHTCSLELVDWMTLVAQSAHTTGAPDPLPSDVLARWRHHNIEVITGGADVFFPTHRLQDPCLSHFGRMPTVIPGAGHLLVDEQADSVADLVVGMS